MPLASTTPKTVPSTVKCAGKHCEKVLNFGKGNLCQLCTVRLRRRSSLVDAGSASHQDDKRVDPIPLGSVSSRLPPSTFDEPSSLMAFEDFEPPMRLDTPKSVEPYPSRRQRPSFTIPYQPPSSRRIPSSITASNSNSGPDINRPPASHFNSRGEYVQSMEYAYKYASPEDLSAEPWPLTETMRQSLSAGNLQDTYKCNYCQYSGPRYHLSSICPSCRLDASGTRSRTTCTTSMIVPVIAQPLASTSTQRDLHSTLQPFPDWKDGIEEDIEMTDLELSYPELPEMGTVEQSPSLPLFTDPIHRTVTSNASNRQPDQPGPSKRLKISHPEIIDLTASRSRRNVAEESIGSRSKTSKSNFSKPFRSLKLCSTANCTGIVSANSSAIRCLNCVRHDWKFRKLKISAPDNKSGSPEIPADEVLEKGTKKKGVTWADEMSKSIHEAPDNTPALPSPNLSTATTNTILSASNNHLPNTPMEQSLHLKYSTNVELSLKSSPTSPKLDDPHPAVQTTSEIQPLVFNTNSQSILTSPFHPAEEINSKRLGGDESQRTLAERPSCSLPADSELALASTSPVQQESGWDSDLTELSDSVDEESESESHSPRPPPKSSGFKIRIPPRPGGVFIRTCASPGCNQLLDATYCWKSCILCRARSREYQRKRQNLKGRHLRLDLELEGHKMGTPLAGDFQRQPDTKEQVGYVPLISGARLCSVRNCTFIIPPVDEYRWKTCSLCRLCQKEKVKQNKYGGQLETPDPISTADGQETQVAPRLIILKALNNLPLRIGPRAPNRCRSLDCGMLLDPKFPQCKQCTARHLWLLNRSGSSGQVPVHNYQYGEKPQRSNLYTQYKSFSALLLDFKNRLSGFLQAQSIFFLFKHLKNAKAMFAFDGEFSIVAPDFDLAKRQNAIDAQALKYKSEIEYVGRIKFNHKRQVLILKGGGVAVRFVAQYSAPVLQVMTRDNVSQISTFTKKMQCELEIANLPDHSHPFIPGQQTIIRFRLLG
ncbi:hypothetical protein HYPSUDRAFT_32243 [Hypholoma sublateritium FD-334 SS-4]|uniref:Uncharacterized protein n=1 Tax=Hypholoma sublateritium (strain FD-334 SS-4) TaxID=945553 RepID=A0A0D2QEZ0_HYPSF|nr:hypothetical protein HYPSUDRAFT_32243 [Hypholoma sublateritium FD-334 SS-4]